MKRLGFLVFLLGSLCWAGEPSTVLSVVVGGDDYVGGQILYDDLGLRVGTFDEQVCTRYCRGRCVEHGTESADLYEFVGALQLHKRWYGTGALGYLHGQDSGASLGVGGEWRHNHLVIGAGWSSAVDWTGSAGYRRTW